MKTWIALFAKLGVTVIAAILSFSLIDNLSFTTAIMIGAIGTAVNYLLGDLVVLPKFGNMVASIGDGLMGALVAYAFLFLLGFSASFLAYFTFAILIIAAEYLFHIFLLKSDTVAPKGK